MPTYEYECRACGHSFERFQSITATPVKVCPVCGRKKVKRLLGTGAGIIFRGSGFYATDYRKSGSGKSGGESTGDDAKDSTPSGDSSSSDDGKASDNDD